MALKKILRDRKNNNIHFFFETKNPPETTEYIIDEFQLERMVENIIASSWFIKKKVNGRLKFPENCAKRQRRHTDSIRLGQER